LLGQADQQEQAEIDRLVTVYEKMKPANAAAVFATLDDKVRIPVAAKMKVSALSQILSQMSPADAKKLTESLAHRYSAAQTLSEAAEAPPPGPPKDAAPASPPTKLAAADTADDGAAKPPIPIHMTVKKPAHRKSLLAHAKRDTPTLAAAKAAAPPHTPPAAPPKQTAAAAKSSPTVSPTPTTPAASAPPAPTIPKAS
jgi:hypothetical protein